MSQQIKNADEMELTINFNAMRLSWVFVITALFIWLVYEWIFLSVLNNKLLIIFSLQTIIFFSSKLLMTKKMSEKRSIDNEE